MNNFAMTLKRFEVTLSSFEVLLKKVACAENSKSLATVNMGISTTELTEHTERMVTANIKRKDAFYSMSLFSTKITMYLLLYSCSDIMSPD